VKLYNADLAWERSRNILDIVSSNHCPRGICTVKTMSCKSATFPLVLERVEEEENKINWLYPPSSLPSPSREKGRPLV
jgi:hypothetical protein